MADAAPDDALARLRAERPELAAQLGDAQLALLQHILFPRASLYRGCLISARGQAHPFRDDWFDGRYTPAEIEAILNVVHLYDEIDTEDDAIHASMAEALPVVADIWRWWLPLATSIPHEVLAVNDRSEYGPTLYFRRVRSEAPEKHFVLIYDFVANFIEKREPHRAAHLALAGAYEERGALVLGGAFADAPAGAMLLFKAESARVAEEFAHEDPYVLNGIVTAWRVREWTTVVGALSLTAPPQIA